MAELLTVRTRHARALEFIETLLDQSEELKGKISDLMKQVAELQSSRGSRIDEEERSRMKAQFDAAIDRERAAAKEREDELTRQLSNAHDTAARESSKSSQLDALRDELKSLNAKCQALVEKNQRMSDSEDTLNATINRMKADAKQQKEQMRLISAERERLELLVSTLQQSEALKLELEEEVKRVKAELKRAQKAMDVDSRMKLDKVAAELQAALQAEQLKVQELRTAATQFAMERDAALEENRRLVNMIGELESKMAGADPRAGSRFAEFIELKNENSRLLDQIQQLRGTGSSSKGRPGSTKSALPAAGSRSIVMAPGGVRLDRMPSKF